VSPLSRRTLLNVDLRSRAFVDGVGGGGRRDRISMPAAGCASPLRLPTVRLGWPASSSTSSTSWIDYRARWVDAHAVDRMIHQYDRAAQELWNSAGLAASSKIEIVAMTLAQLTENGQTLDWWERVPSRKPISLPRTVQAPAGWIVVSQVRLGEN